VSAEVTNLLIVALLSERLVEIVKSLVKPFLTKWSDQRLAALWKVCGLLTGVILAFGMKVNLFQIINVSGYRFLGILLAGVFAGMGTQWVHEILSNLPYDAVRSCRTLNKTREKQSPVNGPDGNGQAELPNQGQS
jgi:hypothetical protein